MSGLVIMPILVGMAVFAPVVSRGEDPLKQDLTNTLASPSAQHWLGTDQLGRDVWSRLLYGARLDLRIAFIAVLFPFCSARCWAAWPGTSAAGWTRCVMRLVDIVVAFPFYVLIIALVFVLGPGERSIYIAITLVGWVSYARIIRGEILVAKRQDYVLAARSGGLSTAHHAAAPAAERDQPGDHLRACPTSSRTSWPS